MFRFFETLSSKSWMLLILMLQRDRIASRGSKDLLTINLWASTMWPYWVIRKKANLLCATFVSLRNGRRDERWRVCRLRKEIELCVTLRLEFKADHVQKIWKSSPINKKPPPLGEPPHTHFYPMAVDLYETYLVLLAIYTKFCHRGLRNDNLLLITI